MNGSLQDKATAAIHAVVPAAKILEHRMVGIRKAQSSPSRNKHPDAAITTKRDRSPVGPPSKVINTSGSRPLTHVTMATMVRTKPANLRVLMYAMIQLK